MSLVETTQKQTRKGNKNKKSHNEFKMKSAEQITVLRSISNTRSAHDGNRNAVDDATANNEHQ